MSQPTARAIPPHLLRAKTASAGPGGRSSAVAQTTSRSSSRRPGLSNTHSSTAGIAASSSSSIASSSSSAGPGDSSLSPQATAALIRRTLCPSSSSAGLSSPRPWQEQLPPLTSSNEVDEQLYAFIAVLLKEYVHTWYGKITPDHHFTDEAVRIVAHCTTQLEARIRSVDWVEVLGDELPRLIDKHISNYDVSRTSSLGSAFVSQRRAYHMLNGHPAFDPPPEDDNDENDDEDGPLGHRKQQQQQQANETAYRQLLVRSFLAVLLPREDMRNPTLRILVGDIIADLILGNVVSGRLCEGWMIWEIIGKAVTAARARSKVAVASSPSPPPSSSQSADRQRQDNHAGRTGKAESDGEEAASRRNQTSLLERYGLLEMVSDSTGIQTSARNGDDGGQSEDVHRRASIPSLILRLLTAVNYIYTALMYVCTIGRRVHTAASLPSRNAVDPIRQEREEAMVADPFPAKAKATAIATATDRASASVSITAPAAGGQTSAPPDTQQMSSATSDRERESWRFVASVTLPGSDGGQPISGSIEAPASANGGAEQEQEHEQQQQQHVKTGVTRTKRKPMLLYAAFDLADRLLCLSKRMPWLVGTLDMVRYHLVLGLTRLGDTDGALDKFLYDELNRRLNISLIPPALLALRAALFPNNAPAPPRKLPDRVDQLAIRRHTAEAILACMPTHLAVRFFGGDGKSDGNGEDGAVREIERLLDVFDDSYCNKHMMFEMIELVVIRLAPEIESKSASELVDEAVGRM